MENQASGPLGHRGMIGRTGLSEKDSKADILAYMRHIENSRIKFYAALDKIAGDTDRPPCSHSEAVRLAQVAVGGPFILGAVSEERAFLRALLVALDESLDPEHWTDLVAEAYAAAATHTGHVAAG